MTVSKTLFAQLMAFMLLTSFGRIVDRYGGNASVRRMVCAEQFREMLFAIWGLSLTGVFTVGQCRGNRSRLRKIALAPRGD